MALAAILPAQLKSSISRSMDVDDELSLDDREIQEYREMIEELGTFPVRSAPLLMDELLVVHVVMEASTTVAQFT